jgi:hypothetical protein
MNNSILLKEYNKVLKELNKKYLTKHISVLNKRLKMIASGFSIKNNGITWLTYNINNFDYTITTQNNRIIEIV